MHIPFIRKRRIFYLISAVLVGAAVFSILNFGLRLGIDFTGGSSLEVIFENDVPSNASVKEKLEEIGLQKVTAQRAGEKGLILKMGEITEETHQKVLEKLSETGKIKEGSESFRSIGPVVGEELKGKTKIVVSLALLAILLYIAFSFRRVSRPVKSYVYGLTSLLALGHDVLIPLGLFAILGHFGEVEISIPIVTAFLTVFGYSINDSVVVFDRVRENLLKAGAPTFEETLEKSLNQSVRRSLFTSLTTLLVLFAIFFFGGESLKYFSLALIMGIGLGTYSSLFLATPLLVSFLRFKERKYKS